MANCKGCLGVAAGGGHSCGVLSKMTGRFSKEAKAFMVIKIILCRFRLSQLSDKFDAICFALSLGHVQVGSYRYRSLLEGLYTL